MVSIIATVNHCDINSKEHKMKPTFINHQRNRRCIILLNSWSETNESPSPGELPKVGGTLYRTRSQSGWLPGPTPATGSLAEGLLLGFNSLKMLGKKQHVGKTTKTPIIPYLPLSFIIPYSSHILQHGNFEGLFALPIVVPLQMVLFFYCWVL